MTNCNFTLTHRTDWANMSRLQILHPSDDWVVHLQDGELLDAKCSGVWLNLEIEANRKIVKSILQMLEVLA